MSKMENDSNGGSSAASRDPVVHGNSQKVAPSQPPMTTSQIVALLADTQKLVEKVGTCNNYSIIHVDALTICSYNVRFLGSYDYDCVLMTNCDDLKWLLCYYDLCIFHKNSWSQYSCQC